MPQFFPSFLVFWSHQGLWEICLPNKQLKKNLIILQTNKLLNSLSTYLRGDAHTQFVTQNVKTTYLVQHTHPPLKTAGVPKYIFVENILHMYHWKQSNRKRPTYHTMITLFDQNRKYYSQNNKILHLVSHMTLQAISLIGTLEPQILFEEVLIGMRNF